MRNAATLAACAFAMCAPFAQAETLRECYWMYGHETGLVDGQGNKWGLPPAAEYYHQVRGCIDFGVPKLCCAMFGTPERKLRDSFAGLERVMFNVTTNRKDPAFHHGLVDNTIVISKEMPNLTGLLFDDFFVTYTKAAFTPEELKEIRRRAKALERPLELHLVAYDFFFRKDPNLGESVEEMRPYYDSFDAVQLWTWQAKDIARQPETLAALRRFAPDKKIYLGLYMWDFGTKREMTADEMKMQLDFALEKWKSREIEGVVFFVTAICNRDFPAVKLAREWAWKNAGCRR
ncbi:MAG: hypothetical protein IJG13_08225 [Kiritimatiellae bacterium]|nr:hypothetical protein [Kiritimatiellia bacterium]MBQ3341145.1 hypothetical protein [Kiritimatiellia bacterium]